MNRADTKQSRAYFFFAALNLIWIPVIFLFYPETKGRSLESIECMFAGSPFYWQMEKAFRYNEEKIEEESGGKDEMVLDKRLSDSDHVEGGGRV